MNWCMFWFAYPLGRCALRVVEFAVGLLCVVLTEPLVSEIARELRLEEMSIGAGAELVSLVGIGGVGQRTEDSVGCDGQWGSALVPNIKTDTVPIGSLQSAGRDASRSSIPSTVMSMSEPVFPRPDWLSMICLSFTAVWCLFQVAIKILKKHIKNNDN